MRIAIVTSFVRSRGTNGEDRAVRDQFALLASAGHEVTLLARETDQLADGPLYPLRAALTVATGRGPAPLAALERFRPDVVHVHNTYPNIGRTWAADLDAAVVVTPHSYRSFCAASTFFRDGRACTDCLATPWSAVTHGCYEGRARSIPYAVAAMRQPDPLLARADRIIALNLWMAELLAGKGYAAGKIVPGTNTAVAALPDAAGAQQTALGDVPGAHLSRPWDGTPPGAGRWLCVGRLTEAKGIRKLVEAWPAGHGLDVAGTGPLADELRDLARPGVRLLGQLGRGEVAAAMARATGLVLPSLWHEVLPLTYIEALAAGLPTLAFDTNDTARLVHEQATGTVVSWDDDLAAVLAVAGAEFRGLAQHCRDVFERRYSPDVYLAELEAIYAEAIEARSANRTDRERRRQR